MQELPTGTVTFLFTDVEAFTRLWEEHPEEMRTALDRYGAHIRSCIEECGGQVFKTVGDSFCASFTDPICAVKAVIESQPRNQSIVLKTSAGTQSLPVKIAIHTGQAEQRDGDFFGPTLNRASRLLAAAHGGQVLLSQAAAALVKENLPVGARLKGLGEHRLKDLGLPESVAQLCHPDLKADFPPLRSLNSEESPNNLPLQLTSFVGREDELQEVRFRLQTCRLLTLTGAGGCGKTRLALQAAAESLEEFRDGVWLVELAALTSAEHVAQETARILGVEDSSTASHSHRVVSHLRDRSLLLILDNCEHLLDSCARFADSVLRNCPRTRILATSREPLGIGGETPLRVPSLAMPDPHEEITAQSISRYDSIRLFLERASLVQSRLELTHQNAPALAAICRRLDGIPLAIELAAARVRSLTVEEVNVRLDRRFHLLTGGPREALPRQQTLRSLIDWSYELLSESDRVMLQRLSVFSGGWSMDAAEDICTGDGVEPWEAIDLLTSLVDKSLVIVDFGKDANRYRLLESIRQYAREKLTEAGNPETWRDRHLTYYTTVAEAGEPQLKGPQQREWLDRLELEHDNLRTALEWAVERPDSREKGIRISFAIWRFWVMRGFVSEGRRHLERLLEHTDTSKPSMAVAGALHAAGNLALVQTDYSSARISLSRAAEMRSELGDLPGSAGSKANVATIDQMEGRLDDARRGFEQALEIFEQLGDPNGRAISLICIGNVTQKQGDSNTAREYLSRGIDVNRTRGDRAAEANGLNNLGTVELKVGDRAAAQSSFERALAINREIGVRFEAALNLWNLGRIAILDGELHSARRYLKESLDLNAGFGVNNGLIETLHSCAELEMLSNRPGHACWFFGVADTMQSSVGFRREEDDMAAGAESINELRNLLGDRFQREYERGRSMDLAEAVSVLREDLADT